MARLTFVPSATIAGMRTYAALAHGWQFLLVDDAGAWTMSYRQQHPRGHVSASSTMSGPFESFDEASSAAESKLAHLRGMA